MANVIDPLSGRRRLLMSAIQSVLIYGSGVWADSHSKKLSRKRLMQVQRQGVLRDVFAYHKISEPAITMIAGAISIPLYATECRLIFSGEGNKEAVACEKRARTLSNHGKGNRGIDGLASDQRCAIVVQSEARCG